jgi:hypothetical protein
MCELHVSAANNFNLNLKRQLFLTKLALFSSFVLSLLAAPRRIPSLFTKGDVVDLITTKIVKPGSQEHTTFTTMRDVVVDPLPSLMVQRPEAKVPYRVVTLQSLPSNRGPEPCESDLFFSN